MAAHNFYWRCECTALASDTIPHCLSCFKTRPDWILAPCPLCMVKHGEPCIARPYDEPHDMRPIVPPHPGCGEP